MMKKLFSATLALGMLASAPSFSADLASAKAIADSRCAACHGKDGISLSEIWPNLAGQKAGYLEAQIKAFRDKVRVNPVMNGMATGLTDEDAKNLAAYYASLK